MPTYIHNLPINPFQCSRFVQHLDGESNGCADDGHGHAADGAKSSSSVGGAGRSRRTAGGAAAARCGGRGGSEDLAAKGAAGAGRLVGGDLLGSSLERVESLGGGGVGVDDTNHAGTAVVPDGLGAVEPDGSGVVDLDLEDVLLDIAVSTRAAV